jgi:hypothetical protein
MRPPEHQKETSASKYIQSVFPDVWVLRPIDPDYGTDFSVEYFHPDGSSTSKIFFIQSKATSKFSRTRKGVFFDIKVNDLVYLDEHTNPALIILYSEEEKTARWVFIQRYIDEILDIQEPNWRKQKKIRIYLSEELLRDSLGNIKEIALDGWRYILRRIRKEISLETELAGLSLQEKIQRISKIKVNKEINLIETSFHEINLLLKFMDDSKATEKIIELIKRLEVKAKKDDLLNAILLILDNQELYKYLDRSYLKNLENQFTELAISIESREYISYLNLRRRSDEYYDIVQELYAQLLHHQHIKDELANFISIGRINNLNTKLLEISKEITDCIVFILKNNNFWLIFKSVLTISSTKGSEAHLLKPFLHPDVFQSLLNDIQFALGLLYTLVDSFDLKQFRHYVMRIEASSFVMNEEIEKAKILYNEAISHASLYQDEAFIQTIKKVLTVVDQGIQINMDNDSLMSEIKKIKKEELERELNNPKNAKIKEDILIGIDDIDPSDILRYCNNLVLKYLSISPLGNALGDIPIGLKLLHCKYSRSNVKGISIQHIFQSFRDKSCGSCDKRAPRSSQWQARFSDINEMHSKQI